MCLLYVGLLDGRQRNVCAFRLHFFLFVAVVLLYSVLHVIFIFDYVISNIFNRIFPVVKLYSFFFRRIFDLYLLRCSYLSGCTFLILRGLVLILCNCSEAISCFIFALFLNFILLCFSFPCIDAAFFFFSLFVRVGGNIRDQTSFN